MTTAELIEKLERAHAELAAMKARGDRLANYAAHAENCGAADIGRCTCGMAQALTEWRDQHHGGNDADT